MTSTPVRIALPRQRNRAPKIRAIGQRRTFEGDLYHYILGHGWLALFVIGLVLFFVINGLFSVAYAAQPGCITNARPGSFVDAFFFSVETMATIGYGEMAPVTPYAYALVTIEALTGVIGFALVAGITFAKFSRPIARVLFSEKAVIAPRDGVPHLMFRMANWRHNDIVEARLSVILLATEVTAEGETMRRMLDLPLVRERTALFSLTWTAMHRIDEQSPFFGEDAITRLRERQAELFLSVHGLDARLAQTIHARYTYALDDITIGARFADVLTLLPDGTRVIDYRRFHDTVPVPARPVSQLDLAPPGASPRPL